MIAPNGARGGGTSGSTCWVPTSRQRDCSTPSFSGAYMGAWATARRQGSGGGAPRSPLLRLNHKVKNNSRDRPESETERARVQLMENLSWTRAPRSGNCGKKISTRSLLVKTSTLWQATLLDKLTPWQQRRTDQRRREYWFGYRRQPRTGDRSVKPSRNHRCPQRSYSFTAGSLQADILLRGRVSFSRSRSLMTWILDPLLSVRM